MHHAIWLSLDRPGEGELRLVWSRRCRGNNALRVRLQLRNYPAAKRPTLSVAISLSLSLSSELELDFFRGDCCFNRPLSRTAQRELCVPLPIGNVRANSMKALAAPSGCVRQRDCVRSSVCAFVRPFARPTVRMSENSASWQQRMSERAGARKHHTHTGQADANTRGERNAIASEKSSSSAFALESSLEIILI